jgi:hypothetical protein
MHPDLAFYQVWAEPTSFSAAGQPFVIYYTIANVGNATAGSHADVIERDRGTERLTPDINV